MDMENEVATMHLKCMYVPSGWFVVKNNIIDVDPGVFDKAFGKASESEKFMILDRFFSSCIFYAYCERYLKDGKPVKCVIDVGCSLLDAMSAEDAQDAEDAEMEFKREWCVYDVNLWLYRKGQSTPTYVFERDGFSSPREVLEHVNRLMWAFNHADSTNRHELDTLFFE